MGSATFSLWNWNFHLTKRNTRVIDFNLMDARAWVRELAGDDLDVQDTT